MLPFISGTPVTGDQRRESRLGASFRRIVLRPSDAVAWRLKKEMRSIQLSRPTESAMAPEQK